MTNENFRGFRIFDKITDLINSFINSVKKVQERSTLMVDDNYNGFVDSDQNESQFKMYLLTIDREDIPS